MTWTRSMKRTRVRTQVRIRTRIRVRIRMTPNRQRTRMKKLRLSEESCADSAMGRTDDFASLLEHKNFFTSCLCTLSASAVFARAPAYHFKHSVHCVVLSCHEAFRGYHTSRSFIVSSQLSTSFHNTVFRCISFLYIYHSSGKHASYLTLSCT